jgi:hypothetical protein
MKVRDVIKAIERDGWCWIERAATIGSTSTDSARSRNDHRSGPPRRRHAGGHAKLDSEEGGAEMKRYAVVFEKTPNNWAAYVPDLPGCVTTGNTLDDTRR